MLKKESLRIADLVLENGFDQALEKENYAKNEFLAYLEQSIHICKEKRVRQAIKNIYLENRFIETFDFSSKSCGSI